MLVEINGGSILIDENDREAVLSGRWNIGKFGQKKYAYKAKGKLLHRSLVNAPKGMCVDHINGDTLDNRRENLRVCTWAQNSLNRAKHKHAIHSIYKGVGFENGSSPRKWSARVHFNGVRKRVGRYATEIEAAKAYDKFALIAYGEFAKLNFSSTGSTRIQYENQNGVQERP